VRNTLVVKKWIALHVLFVLVAQFAPTIHNAFPHHDEESSCAHPGRSLHLEKDERDSNASPCFFCAHHGGRSAVPISFVRLVEERVSLRIPPIPETRLPDGLALLIPESRGPPVGL
jgi:hypothetical protein